MKDKILLWFMMLIPRFRVMLGFCPICNSAPELDSCPMCGRYAKGDRFPPSPELKREWLTEIKTVCRIQIEIKKLVKESERKRLDL